MKERVPPRQIGIIAMSKGPYFEPISAVIEVSNQHRRKKKRNPLKTSGKTRTRPLKKGHGPLLVMYPVSLMPK
jgi:hypothetical protein